MGLPATAKDQAAEDHIIAIIRPNSEDTQDDDFRTLPDEILELVNDNLQEHGILLNVLEYSSEDLSTVNSQNVILEGIEATGIHPLAVIWIYPRDIEVQFLTSPVAQVSPILDEPTIRFDWSPSMDSLEIIADAITGTLLYLDGQCALLTPYLDSALASGTVAMVDQHFVKLEINCAILAGDFDNAINMYESFEESLMADRESLDLAWLYLRVGREEDALEMAAEVIRHCRVPDPEGYHTEYCVGQYSRRAQVYALAFHYDEAIADMDAAIELDPDNPELYVLRGQIVILLYEWDRVLADYNHAIELDPDYADAYYYRGILHYTAWEGLREDALADFERYLELAPDGEHAQEAAANVTEIQALLAE